MTTGLTLNVWNKMLDDFELFSDQHGAQLERDTK